MMTFSHQNFSHRFFQGDQWDHHKCSKATTVTQKKSRFWSSNPIVHWCGKKVVCSTGVGCGVRKDQLLTMGPWAPPTWSLWGETGPATLADSMTRWMVGTLMLLKACHLSHHSPQPVPGREKASSRVVQNFTAGINSQLAQPLKPLTCASKLGRHGVKLGLELHFIHEGNGTQSTCHENPFSSTRISMLLGSWFSTGRKNRHSISFEATFVVADSIPTGGFLPKCWWATVGEKTTMRRKTIFQGFTIHLHNSSGQSKHVLDLLTAPGFWMNYVQRKIMSNPNLQCLRRVGWFFNS